MSGHRPERTIVVTHGRLVKTADEIPEVPLFLFGPSQGLKDIRMGRSPFVNVSALDHVVPVMPEGSTKRLATEMRDADIGAYTIIEISEAGGIKAVSHPLRVMPSGWKRVSGFRHGRQPLVQEDI